MVNKTFVLDAQTLLSFSDTPLRFGEENEVVIPLCVLQEIATYSGNYQKQKIAKNIAQYLCSLSRSKFTEKGVRQENGSILYIAQNFHDIAVNTQEVNRLQKRILQTCIGLQNKYSQSKVILISKDPIFRIIADSLGIIAEDFKEDLFPEVPQQYKGRLRIDVSKDVIDTLHSNKILLPGDIYNFEISELYLNQFVELCAPKGANRLLRYNGTGLVPLNWNQDAKPRKITPKSIGQNFLLECLYQSPEDASLVIAKGDAGTGKTYCSLAVGLEMIDAGLYRNILVATPNETVGQEKIGFLPGDIEQKISPYLGGIIDNLERIINPTGSAVKKDGKEYYEKGEYLFQKGLINVQPIGFLRGRTIPNTLFIIDEAQNIKPEDIMTIVTRAAEGSKFVFLGDPTQIDNPVLNERYNGLVYLSESMKGDPNCWQITMEGKEESVRSKLAYAAIEKLSR